MAWNADGTRMPYAMHSEYLNRLFLNDELARGKYQVDERSVSLSALRAPIFAVGTEKDHVAPWKSVHKIHLLTNSEITFILTSGGHNAGIVSEPGHPRRYFHMLTRKEDGLSFSPDEWLDHAARQQGSWWSAWGEWLNDRSSPPIAPPPMGAPDKGYAPITDAPGTYILEK